MSQFQLEIPGNDAMAYILAVCRAIIHNKARSCVGIKPKIEGEETNYGVSAYSYGSQAERKWGEIPMVHTSTAGTYERRVALAR